MKDGQKLKLGDAHVTPISKKYKHQSLGMPKATPSSLIKISGHLSRHYIFIASYAMCFQFSFVLFAVINGWTPTYFF
jgi:hypothetical protein